MDGIDSQGSGTQRSVYPAGKKLTLRLGFIFRPWLLDNAALS
jgi:hypothetical protein